MVYDSNRNRMVMFGGANQFGQLQGDTWEWTGSSWTQVATTGPAPRAFYCMAFDSRRGVVVLYGGENSTQAFSDTWEWNGTSWSQVSTSGPAGQVGAGMAFDEARGVSVLFGGSAIDGTTYGETWTWDGLSWTFQSAASPAPRSRVSLSYDRARQRTVLFGGNGRQLGFLADTWEWDGTQWNAMSGTGPSKRDSYCLAYDAGRGKTLLYGGYNGPLPYLDDAWEWNGTSWTLVASGGPGGRAFAAMGYTPAQQAMLLFGGALADPTHTWVWLGPPIQITQPPTPLAVSCGSSAALGVAATGPAPLTFQWRLNGVALNDDGRITGSTTASISISPARLTDQGSYDVVVTSPCGSLASDAAALTVNPLTLTITQQPAPQSVTCGQPATFSVASSGTPPLSYSWQRFGVPLTDDGRVSGSTTATLSIAPTIASDAGSYSVVVSTDCASATSNSAPLGVSGGGPTITMQPTNQVSDCGQAVSFTAAASGGTSVAWQRAGDGAFLQDGGRITGAHSFTLSINPVLPSDAGTYLATVSNPCGQTNSDGATLSIPSSTPYFIQQPTRSVVALGASATFMVVAAGSQNLTYQWRRGGLNLADGGNVAGSTTATLTISPVSASDAALYEVVVSNTCGSVASGAPLVLSGCDPSWQQISATGPSARQHGSMVYDSGRDRVVLFGGADGAGRMLGDTWEWDGATWTQVATTGPAPRHEFSMSYDSRRGKVVVFGGASSTATFADTWEWDGTTWTQVATDGPAGRFEAGMAYDEDTGVTILFGGSTIGGSHFGDTWQWDGAQWSQLPVAGPGARAFPSMSYDPPRHRIVLFGGLHQFYFGDTWEWDGTSWIGRGVSGPSPRRSMGMAYDVVCGATVLYGGYQGGPGPLDDTWEYDGVQWTQEAASGPGARQSMFMGYDGHGLPIMLGGFPGLDPTTWSWTISPATSFTTQPANQTSVAGQSATFSVVAVPATGLSYQWSRGSTPLVDGGNISGATSATLTVGSVSPADEGYYSVTASGGCGTAGSTAGRLRVVCGSAPAISQQPADLLVAANGGVSFSVVASACLQASYQWRKNDVPISGATSANYSIAHVGAGDAGLYSVEVSAGGLTAVSREASLNLDPGPVFVSYAAMAPDPSDALVTWTLRDPATVRVEYGATNALGSTSTASGPGTTGSLLVPRGNLITFFYRLVAVDALNVSTATSVTQVVFPASVYKLAVVATAYPYLVPFNGANLGAKMTITVTNQGNLPITGAIRVTAAKLGKAVPKQLTGQPSLPLAISNGLVVSASSSGDLLFRKSDIGSASGAQVTFTATIIWAETSAPGSPTHTASLSQRVRVP